MGRICAVLILAVSPVAIAAGDPLQSAVLSGRVMVEGTDEPVPGAKVCALLPKSTPHGGTDVKEAETDSQGRYSVEVPVGHLMFCLQSLPPGFWSEAGFPTAATTPASPSAKHDFKVRRGPQLVVEIVGITAPVPEKSFVSVMQNGDNVLRMASNPLDAVGQGQMTMPGSDGDFRIQAFSRAAMRSIASAATLSIDKNFRLDAIAAVASTGADSFSIRDSAGHTARVQGAEPVLNNGQLTVKLKGIESAEKKLGRVIGRVVDEVGAPIPNAQVTVILGEEGGGSSMTEHTATTAADGSFSIEGLDLRDNSDSGKRARVSLAVVAEGWGGVDTRGQLLPESADRPADFGRIRLSQSREIAIRVVGDDGKPLIGAWVEPQGTYADRTQLTSSDNDGRCVVRNLCPGWHNFTARFGDQYASMKAEASQRAQEVVLYIRPQQALRPPPKLTPIVAGNKAPELRVHAWTDGGAHKLSDFRGRVVVLNFWGKWCGPCMREIPTLVKLQDRFSNQDAAFISVHTSDGDLREIRDIAGRMNWKSLLALDMPAEEGSGQSTNAFGVEGFPTLFVIDRNGRVAFTMNGMEEADFMKLMEQSAKATGVAWPIDESEEDTLVEDKFHRIAEHLLAKQIDAALNAK